MTPNDIMLYIDQHIAQPISEKLLFAVNIINRDLREDKVQKVGAFGLHLISPPQGSEIYDEEETDCKSQRR